MPLTDDDKCAIQKMMDAKIEAYFNHYLLEIFPEQVRQIIANHDANVDAHRRQIESAVSKRFDRIRVLAIGVMAGLALAGGVGGLQLLKLFGIL